MSLEFAMDNLAVGIALAVGVAFGAAFQSEAGDGAERDDDDGGS